MRPFHRWATWSSWRLSKQLEAESLPIWRFFLKGGLALIFESDICAIAQDQCSESPAFSVMFCCHYLEILNFWRDSANSEPAPANCTWILSRNLYKGSAEPSTWGGGGGGRGANSEVQCLAFPWGSKYPRIILVILGVKQTWVGIPAPASSTRQEAHCVCKLASPVSYFLGYKRRKLYWGGGSGWSQPWQ